MQKRRIFISSVQSEFAEERQMLFEYLTSDALLGKFFERMGTGTEEMTKQCLEKGLSKPEFIPSYGFQTIIKREVPQEIEQVTEQVTEKGTEKLTNNQEKIINTININSNITINELVKEVGITASKIKENLSKLKAKGLIERIGPDKGGYWRIKYNYKNTKI